MEGSIVSRIVNYTGHVVTLIDKDDTMRVFSIAGKARLIEHPSPARAYADGVSIQSRHFSEVRGLPDEELGTFVLVPKIVALAKPYRRDLIVPDAGKSAVWSGDFRVLRGVRRFICYARSGPTPIAI